MEKIKIIISMDWEGCDLKEQNLDSIREFKSAYHCPITHYLNPGYYTNPRTKEDNVTDKIRSTVLEDDEPGLHLHAPRHFVEAAGVGLKSSPAFSKHGDYNSGAEHGQEVMLHGYSKEELDQMISLSKSILAAKGFENLKSFRAGGWMCDDKLAQSLADHDFEIESSATVASLLEGSSWENDNLGRYISMMWEDIDMDSSPYFFQSSEKEMLELPNNFGAIDYWRPEWIEALVEKCLAFAKSKNGFLAVINSHQETFKENVEKLKAFIELLRSKFSGEIEFTTNRAVLSELKTQGI